ncbi:MAG: UDP-N-acetylmuramoyl-L-alanine--D-glutamate ligase, partial [Burkholderiales bacterium]
DGKGQDFSPLRQLVAAKCKSVAIIGRDQLAMAQVLSGLTIPIQCCASLDAAVKFCLTNAFSGDAVVLSPACASWDMFKDYKHRAKVFIESIYANIG